MKKILSVLLCLVLLLGLGACGDMDVENASTHSGVTTETPQIAEAGGYLIPAQWQESSRNDGTMGYLTAEAQVPSGTPNGSVIESIETDADGNVTMYQYDLSGYLIHAVTATPQAKMASADQSIAFYSFGADSLWLVRMCYELLDEETGEYQSCNYLEQWSYDSGLLFSATLDTYGIDDMENYLMGMELGSQDTPILFSATALIFLDEKGQEAGRYETGGIWYTLCRDSSGRIYLVDEIEANCLYALDEDHFSLGEKVMDLDGSSKIFTGGGEYDLFFSSDTTLKGVSFQTGTVTEILSWADWDLANSVSGLAVLKNGDYLLRVNNLAISGSVMLTMTPVPMSQVPEKTILRVAVPLSQDYLDMGLTWTDFMDEKVAGMISLFNQQTPDYRLEVTTFSSATALNLMLTSGAAPDLIYWNYTAWLDDPASSALLAKKGYLEDLEPYFDGDEELNLSQFMPNILEIERNRNGGLYALPLAFYVTGLTAQMDYAGDGPDWSISDALNAAQNMPEDMDFWSYVSQEEALNNLFGACDGQFVDIETGECNFQTQSFYDLLTLCRDYFPATIDENTVAASGGSLISGFGTMGRLGQFYTDTIRPLEEQGQAVYSYPGSTGTGLNVVFMDQFSICSQSQYKDIAWEFLRSLYSYDFQYSFGSVIISLRQDVVNDREDAYQQMYPEELSQEESQYIRDLVSSSTNYRDIENPVFSIISEEATAFFAGDKSAEDVAGIIENRVKIYLSEQS